MAEQNAAQQVRPISSPRPMEVLVEGKCLEVRTHNGVKYHTIVVPSEDQFKAPPLVEVRADRQFVNKDQQCRALCRVGGYRQSWKSVDDRTGEQVKNHKSIMTLDLVTAL